MNSMQSYSLGSHPVTGLRGLRGIAASRTVKPVLPRAGPNLLRPWPATMPEDIPRLSEVKFQPPPEFSLAVPEEEVRTMLASPPMEKIVEMDTLAFRRELRDELKRIAELERELANLDDFAIMESTCLVEETTTAGSDKESDFSLLEQLTQTAPNSSEIDDSDVEDAVHTALGNALEVIFESNVDSSPRGRPRSVAAWGIQSAPKRTPSVELCRRMADSPARKGQNPEELRQKLEKKGHEAAERRRDVVRQKSAKARPKTVTVPASSAPQELLDEKQRQADERRSAQQEEKKRLQKEHNKLVKERCQARIVAMEDLMQKAKLHTGVLRSRKAGISWNIMAITEPGHSAAGDEADAKSAAENGDEEVLNAMASCLLTIEPQAPSKALVCAISGGRSCLTNGNDKEEENDIQTSGKKSKKTGLAQRFRHFFLRKSGRSDDKKTSKLPKCKQQLFGCISAQKHEDEVVQEVGLVEKMSGSPGLKDKQTSGKTKKPTFLTKLRRRGKVTPEGARGFSLK